MSEEPQKDIGEAIEEFAELQFTTDEIAVITGVTVADLETTYATEVQRGRLRAEAEVRAAILQMAKQGSTPAQKEFMSLARRRAPTG